MKSLLRDVLNVVIFSALIIVLALVPFLIFVNIQFRELKNLKRYVRSFVGNKIPEPFYVGQKTDFHEIRKTLSKHAENLIGYKENLQKLIEENYDFQESSDSELDRMINDLRQNLTKTRDSYKEERERSEIQIWIRKGRFEVANVQRIEPHNVEKLAGNIVKTIMDYAEASVAGMYLLYDEKEEPYLQLVAAYAYSDTKHLKRRFSIGEGLVGTCARERKNIQTEKIDENYLTVATGLNKLSPKFLYLTPIIYQDKLVAVCEYAFLEIPEKHKIEFIEQLSQNIAAWIDTAVNSTQMKKLLEISQTQTEELHAKEKLLNDQIVQMQKLETENEKRTAEMQSMLNALNHTVMRVEYTPDGIVLDANDLYLKTMDYRLDQIKGKNVFDIVKDQRDELWRTVQRVKKGESIEHKIIRHTADGKLKELYASYTPFYDAEGIIERIIFFGFDLTEHTS